MKITFFSNFLNHHQLPFCIEMQKILHDNFKFVATETIPEERLSLGYDDMNKSYDFVVRSYEDEEMAYKLGIDSDIVIIGSAPTKYIKERLKSKKITFRYSERIFREGFNIRKWLALIKNYTIPERKNVYLLCSSAYSARDFNLAGAYINKCLKWGYFPETIEYSKKEIIEYKNNSIPVLLWVAKFSQLKHPEKVITLAEKLKSKKIKFKINMIGDGPLYKSIFELIKEKKLTKEVKLLGAINNKNVRKYMNESNIFLFTSDYQEGWGAVVNEAMNSGCACVLSDEVGSVPFLINEKNGITYSNNKENDLYEKVLSIIENKEKQIDLGLNAYETILKYWNAKYAVKSLLYVSNNLINNMKLTYYDKVGPCSKAEPIKEPKRRII